MTTDDRWCLPQSGYDSMAMELIQKHLDKIERAIYKLAEGYAEERAPDGPIVVTAEDAELAIQNYEV